MLACSKHRKKRDVIKPKIVLINIDNSSNQGMVFTNEYVVASIGYKVVPKDGKIPKVWSIYQEPFEIPEGSRVISQAYRIGFIPSEIIKELNTAIK